MKCFECGNEYLVCLCALDKQNPDSLPEYVETITLHEDMKSNTTKIKVDLKNGKHIEVNFSNEYLNQYNFKSLKDICRFVTKGVEPEFLESPKSMLQLAQGGWISKNDLKNYYWSDEYDKHHKLPGNKNAKASVLAKQLPGIQDTVCNPVTGSMTSLHNVIVNLNDTHRWTREQIADWLETLDIDLRFKTD